MVALNTAALFSGFYFWTEGAAFLILGMLGYRPQLQKKRLIIRLVLISQVIDFLIFVFQIWTEGSLAGETDDTPHFRKNYQISSGNPRMLKLP